MDTIKTGDIVTRRSHNHDVLFKVVRVRSDGCVDLKGLAFRLEANAPITDLVKVNPKRVETLAETRERLISTKKQTRNMVSSTWWKNHTVHKNIRHT